MRIIDIMRDIKPLHELTLGLIDLPDNIKMKFRDESMRKKRTYTEPVCIDHYNQEDFFKSRRGALPAGDEGFVDPFRIVVVCKIVNGDYVFAIGLGNDGPFNHAPNHADLSKPLLHALGEGAFIAAAGELVFKWDNDKGCYNIQEINNSSGHTGVLSEDKKNFMSFSTEKNLQVLAAVVANHPTLSAKIGPEIKLVKIVGSQKEIVDTFVHSAKNSAFNNKYLQPQYIESKYEWPLDISSFSANPSMVFCNSDYLNSKIEEYIKGEAAKRLENKPPPSGRGFAGKKRGRGLGSLFSGCGDASSSSSSSSGSGRKRPSASHRDLNASIFGGKKGDDVSSSSSSLGGSSSKRRSRFSLDDVFGSDGEDGSNLGGCSYASHELHP